MSAYKTKNGKQRKVPLSKKSISNNGTSKKATENENPYTIFKQIFILCTCVKVMLIPAYHSTDFEVHRNWLAITHSLPIREWYTNAKSQWTLDYPPLFAWFEYILSQVAVFIDPQMLKIDNLNYNSYATKVFQRVTVIVADCVFAYGVHKTGRQFCEDYDSYVIFTFLSLCNTGLLVVDHIHFQYNGFLLGILLLSIVQVSNAYKDKTYNEKQVLIGAALFAVLLNLKHIYLYIAPAYIVWLLKWSLQKNFIKRIMKLAAICLLVLFISFGPFVMQLPEILSRLFPFKRGLLHAYWAANMWALYAGVDKVLTFVWKQLGLLKDVKIASMTGGLVQEESFTILPTPTPLITFFITFISMLPVLYLLFKKNFEPKYFIKCVVLCGFCSFMFGWHVHEKAILTVIIPLCILGVTNADNARFFIVLSSAGHTALFPLLYPSNLAPLKIMMSLMYIIATSYLLTKRFSPPLLRIYELMYVVILPFVTVYETILHRVIFEETLPFLPLALTSIYCAIGVLYCFVLVYCDFIYSDNSSENKLNEKKDTNDAFKELHVNDKKL